MLDYSKEKASEKKPNTKVVAKSAYPNLSDVFSTNTLAISKIKLSLYDEKNGKVVRTIPKGQQFNLLEKDNNYWLTVKYGEKTHYTIVPFNKYSPYFTVKNLARVTTDLNVRKKATVDSEQIAIVHKKDYIQLALDKNYAPIKENGWYKVMIVEQYGWVSGQYIVRELKR